MPKILIVTITRNSSHILPSFLNGYKKYASDYPLVVVDNHSRDGDIELLEHYKNSGTIAHLIKHKKNMLFSHSINHAMELYGKDYDQIFIINPDVEFAEGWNKYALENKGITGFVLVKDYGVIDHAGATGGGDHIGRGVVLKPGEQYMTESKVVPWVTFAAVAITKELYYRVKGLDMNFPHFGSDREFCSKAKSMGYEVICSPLQLIHRIGGSTRPYVFCDIPDDIWKLHVKERRNSGVNFPSDQSVLEKINWE